MHGLNTVEKAFWGPGHLRKNTHMCTYAHMYVQTGMHTHGFVQQAHVYANRHAQQYFAHMHTHTRTYKHTCANRYACTLSHMHAHMYTHVCTYACANRYAHTYLHACTCTYKHTCADRHTCTLTHTHTLQLWQAVLSAGVSWPLPSSAPPAHPGWFPHKTGFPSGSRVQSWAQTPAPPQKKCPSRSFSWLTRTICSSASPLQSLCWSGNSEPRY